ncbi:hypothetical protein [Croceibacterium mercuriale]|uniref:hypothetical protein n=1 Tax=Croceibacterium mercuriale TaxID=1572751 RepID=UPI0006918953|nr:hypothetical protein [Croceibacterium mercuriale]
MLFVYDDSEPAPAAIREIIGVERFGAVLKRKQRLADLVERAVTKERQFDFVRISDAASRDALADQLARRRDDDRVIRLPSGLIPVDLDMFARTLRKLPYAPGPAMFGGRFDDEAVTLLTRTDTIALLNIREPRQRRSFFDAIAETSLAVDNAMKLLDLRSVGNFLAYMIGATEVRFFNASQVSGDVFRKSSTDIAKMQGEHGFFHVVPDAMKRFLLPTFDYREEGGRASYAMENLSVPDAALQIVHHSFDAGSFARLLDRFFEFLDARGRQETGTDRVRAVARDTILAKMHHRLDELLTTDAGRRLDALLASSGPRGGIADMRRQASALIERAIATDRSSALAVGHGDPCLSNILFSRNIGLFRLIDPRGATSLDEAWMHPLYDLAKFSHSIMGGYDFVNNGLFECRVGHDLRLALELDGHGPPGWMKKALADRLAATGHDQAVIRAYELSLFLSMLPLHLDTPRKLPGFCLIACAIMDELEGKSV